MTERLLQYIWQFQYLDTTSLQTTDAQKLKIISAGTYNTNQGPDFLNAKVIIDNNTWAGSIELHINASDWRMHNHSSDKNYNNVILHVVWNNNLDLNLAFPTLEIQDHVSKLLLNKYTSLMQSELFIPCEKLIKNTNPIIITKWKERLLIERLQQKTVYIESLLKRNSFHWEETFWWMLAHNFGSRINSDAFEKTAQSISINTLARHKNNLLQLEAILLGQAGLLSKSFNDDYPVMLQQEYKFMQKKYRLIPILHPMYFLRMRPANFPTIRFAQLAMVLHQTAHLFSTLKEMSLLKDAATLFNITANDYWHYHYVFDEISSFKKKNIGKQMTLNILINTVIPIMYAYGYFTDNETLKDKALVWMQQAAAENNSITDGFKMLEIENKSAFDSQALIQLKNEYCDKKYCLQCAIGNNILKEGNK